MAPFDTLAMGLEDFAELSLEQEDYYIDIIWPEPYKHGMSPDHRVRNISRKTEREFDAEITRVYDLRALGLVYDDLGPVEKKTPSQQGALARIERSRQAMLQRLKVKPRDVRPRHEVVIDDSDDEMEDADVDMMKDDTTKEDDVEKDTPLYYESWKAIQDDVLNKGSLTWQLKTVTLAERKETQRLDGLLKGVGLDGSKKGEVEEEDDLDVWLREECEMGEEEWKW